MIEKLTNITPVRRFATVVIIGAAFTAGCCTGMGQDPEFSLDENDPGQVAPLGTAGGPFAFKGYQFRGSTPFAGDEVRFGETWRSVLPMADSDSDGLDDEWELAHWGNLAALPGEDPDDDGVNNFDGCAAGTHPLQPGSFLRIEALSLNPANLSVEWYSAWNRFYRLQESTDLETWSDVGTLVRGDGRYLAVPFADTPDPNRFFRVRVSTQFIPETNP